MESIIPSANWGAQDLNSSAETPVLPPLTAEGQLQSSLKQVTCTNLGWVNVSYTYLPEFHILFKDEYAPWWLYGREWHAK